MAILTCKNLSVAYDGKYVIKNADFEIEEGDYVLIVGENGSGKSTLIKTILSLVEPSGGRLCFEGGLKQNEIGYLAQQSEIRKEFPASVIEVVMSGFCAKNRSPFYSREQKKAAIKSLKKLDMQKYIKSPVSTLSGGQQKRVLLARSLCATQKMILCDEPTAGLDAIASSQLYSSIKKLNDEKITIMMVTHDLTPLPYANKIIHMGNDKMYFMQKDEYIKSDIAKNLFGNIL